MAADHFISKTKVKVSYEDVSSIKMIIASTIEDFSKGDTPSTHVFVFTPEATIKDGFRYSHSETNGGQEDALAIERQFNDTLPRDTQALLITRLPNGDAMTIAFTRELEAEDKALRNLINELKSYADNYKPVNKVLKAIGSRGDYKDYGFKLDTTERTDATNDDSQSDRVDELNIELITYANRIILSCDLVIDIMETAIDDGFLVCNVSSIKTAHQDIHNAYIKIISEGRLQSVGFFNTRWDFQYKRILDYARFLQAWCNMARFVYIGNDNDSIFSKRMCRYIINGARTAIEEAESLIHFCKRYEPFDFDRKDS